MQDRIGGCEYEGDIAQGNDTLLEIAFVLLLALLAIVADQDLSSRFAVPFGPTARCLQLDEHEYEREVIVSLGATGALAVNGMNVEQDELLETVTGFLQENGNNQVVYNADPTIPHGEAEQIHLALLQAGIIVLKEYEKPQDENR